MTTQVLPIDSGGTLSAGLGDRNSETRASGLADVVRNPIYATGVGLLLFGHENDSPALPDMPMGRGVNGAWERMKSWFQGNF